MKQENIQATKKLISFIENSPTAFHAVQQISAILEDAGFMRLHEHEEWKLQSGGRYYVTRNQSSVIAFAVPEEFEKAFMLTASHTDSPTYKLKTESETEAFGKYVKLNVEGYGGMIASSWVDRPLSVAGRVLCKKDGKISSALVKVDRDLLLIPNVAVHQNRNINSGFTYNPAVDMMPLFGAKDQNGSLKTIIADEAETLVETVSKILKEHTPVHLKKFVKDMAYLRLFEDTISAPVSILYDRKYLLPYNNDSFLPTTYVILK